MLFSFKGKSLLELGGNNAIIGKTAPFSFAFCSVILNVWDLHRNSSFPKTCVLGTLFPSLGIFRRSQDINLAWKQDTVGKNVTWGPECGHETSVVSNMALLLHAFPFLVF